MPPSPPPASDTIAAQATPAGRGGVGVVRVSGPAASALASDLTGRCLAPREATLCKFRAEDGSSIDAGLAIFFPAPRSFTGEDVLELQGHGGPVVMSLLLARCLRAGARMARPGEFSERAFRNGKLDLAQAEAVADLIDASTVAAARSAMRSLSGEFSAAIGALADTLVHLRALTEASLDFADEDIETLGAGAATDAIDQLLDSLAEVTRRAHRGRLLRDGLHVVLIGQPNVGKSSLLNRLAGEEVAIVSEHAGTTRDSLRSVVQVRGLPLNVVDTAGLRDTDDAVEQLGIARTWREVSRADIALVVADARCGVSEADRRIIARLPAGVAVLTVLNKSDLLAGDSTPIPASALLVSAHTGAGLPALEEALLASADWHPGEDAFVARERHLAALRAAEVHLRAARQQVAAMELFAEELRLAHRALQEITGEFTTEDLLGLIFAGFCIGK